MVTHCNSKKIKYKNRLLLYKTVVRAQLDYGIPVINHDHTEIQRLEELKNRAVTQMLKINQDSHHSTVNAINNLPSIRNRIQTMKVNFYLKLQVPKPNTLSHLVYRELCKGHQIRPQHKDRLPPLVEANKITQEQNLQGYLL